MDQESLRKALRGYQERVGGATGEMVGVHFRYEDGSEYFEFFPSIYAEIIVAMTASGEWTPYEFQLETTALEGVEITSEMVQRQGKRVVSVKIEYSKLPDKTGHTKEELASLDALRPDIRIDPKYDRRRPLL